MLRRRAPRRVAPAPLVINAVDEQSDQLIDLDQWSGLMANLLQAEGVSGPGEANLVFVGVDAIAALNRLHMGVDGPTDVLSFPIDANEPLDDGDDERMVGDVVICPAVAADQAPGHAGTFPDEIALLLTHGVLHLLGHDHAEDDERARMWRRERELLDQWYGPLLNDPWSVR